jgi:acetylornithine deacetylase/succinyl-diaminopimelate desuccinylase-like protein
VQPPAPLELWESDPFEPAIRDEWLYARGVADDKGQLWMLLHAAGLLAADGALPVNIRVVSDGEEEVGGQSIVQFLEQDERGADACVIFDGGMEGREKPALSVATRGLAAFNLRVRTGQRDLHSGMYGNAALNAIHALTTTLGGILPRGGRVPEPLRVGIAPVTDEERAAWAHQPAGVDVLRDAGAIPYDPQAAEEFYLRTTAEPSVEVNGILGGKPGLKNTTVISEAQANFTVRLAPGQTPEQVVPEVVRLLHEAAPEGATVEVEELEGSTRPGLVPADSPVIKIAQDAFESAFGVRPILTRAGGTLPIMPALQDKGIPTILTGFALPESNVHSPNERMLVDYFPRGVATIRELFTRLGDLS